MRRGVIGLAGLVLAGVLVQRWAERRDRHRLPPPGQMIEVGDHRLHLLCKGTGEPAVVFESGLPGVPLPSFHPLQTGVAAFTRACSYDRAGIGWSEPGPAPRTARRIAVELRRLLRNAGLGGPYVLVGLSFGSLYVRLFAREFPHEVAGLVLIDPSHEEMEAQLPPPLGRAMGGTEAAMRLMPWLARVGLLRLLGPRLPLLTLLDGLPDDALRSIRTLYAGAAHWRGARAEVAAWRATLAEVRRARAAGGDLGDLPLAVITAQGTWRAQPFPGLDPEAAATAWHALHADLVSLSSRGRHIVLDGATHTDTFASPAYSGTVVATIRDVVEAARRGA